MNALDLLLDRTEAARNVWKAVIAVLLVACVVFPSPRDNVPLLRGAWAAWACWYLARNPMTDAARGGEHG